MKKMPKISESELEVMKIIWELKQASSSEIVERLVKTTCWKPKTIHTLINRLVEKGALKAEKSKGKAYIYFPVISEEEYRSHASKTFLEKVFNGSLSLMLASFIKEQKVSKEEIEKLKKLLDEEV
ncbi:BlaI/MecI/CopY family transcriptional regulator [Caldanaerobacter subterraneus]|uniref:CopY family transcriptional repressor n=1 Tax=Caldanaerobacter subterraneus TaxID=911092 RepID=A0A4R2J6B9_9THEO|nr:BlaI/MecI/CopY family transcriptional regulator [Caldanaerobacter subterraneus]TCO53964.1 CopY family transcriptional repressor [Caldanaerobacter subterraneus]